MINLYTWSTPNGRKVSIMLEETGLPYVVHPVDLGKNDQFDEDFLQISPNNKIPAIVDEDNGYNMMESGAILVYLAEKTGMLMPDVHRWQILEWLMWQMSGLGPNCGQAHHYMHFNPGVSEYTERRLKVEIQRLYTVLDDQLEENEFVAGAYSIADISLWPWVSRFEWHRVDLHEFENIKRWYLEIADRPAVRKGYDIPATGNEIPVP